MLEEGWARRERASARQRRRVGVVALATCALLARTASVSYLWATGRGAAELRWEEAVRILQEEPTLVRRRSALEALRRHMRDALALVERIETGDDALAAHARNVRTQLHEATR